MLTPKLEACKLCNLTHEKGKTMSTLLKPSQVAARLNVSRRAAYYLISSGELPSVKVGPQTIRVDEDDLNAYIEARRTEKRDENENSTT